jgi:uncharacterized protein with PIN domain
MAGFTAAERRQLALRLAAGEAPRCPVCDARLSEREVPVSRQVAYVRRRVWLLCPSCGRTGAIDVRDRPISEDERP